MDRGERDRGERDLTTGDLASPERRQGGLEAPPQESTSPAGGLAPPERREGGAGAAQQESTHGPLLAADAAGAFRSRWEAVQISFVDEPRHAVEQADGLVAEVMRELAETFANERSHLEGQWDRGGDVSTDELRVALQRYRSFFHRLLET